MKKTPYEVLALQLDKLYTFPIDPNDEQAIAEHCEMIARFVEGSGWDLDEFIREGLKEYLSPDLSKMN